MSQKIKELRVGLIENLQNAGSQIDWSHISKQIGMFAYTGMNQEQVQKLRNDYSIYLTMDGRASISGLNKNNLENVALAMHEITKEAGL